MGFFLCDKNRFGKPKKTLKLFYNQSDNIFCTTIQKKHVHLRQKNGAKK